VNGRTESKALHGASGGSVMTRSTAWMCLGGGVILFGIGVQRLWHHGDWALLILSILIGAFSISALIKLKNRP
jgi:hypothetical protein